MLISQKSGRRQLLALQELTLATLASLWFHGLPLPPELQAPRANTA